MKLNAFNTQYIRLNQTSPVWFYLDGKTSPSSSGVEINAMLEVCAAHEKKYDWITAKRFNTSSMTSLGYCIRYNKLSMSPSNSLVLYSLKNDKTMWYFRLIYIFCGLNVDRTMCRWATSDKYITFIYSCVNIAALKSISDFFNIK